MSADLTTEQPASKTSSSIKKRQLPRLPPTEGRTRKLDFVVCNAGFAAGHVKHLVHLLRENPFAAHPLAEFRVVKLPTAQGAQAIQDFVLLFREMMFEPFLEQRRDGVR